MVDQIYDPESKRGQLMERMTFVQSGELALDAIYLRGEYSPPILICPSMFAYGGMMNGPVANEIAYMGAYAGYGSLRFAWRGLCGSQGTMIEPGDSLDPLLEDIESSRIHLCESLESYRIAIVGLCDGAYPVVQYVKKNHHYIKSIILIDPPEDTEILSDVTTVAIFPGEIELPEKFANKPPCAVITIPECDRNYQRHLNLLAKKTIAAIQNEREITNV